MAYILVRAVETVVVLWEGLANVEGVHVIIMGQARRAVIEGAYNMKWRSFALLLQDLVPLLLLEGIRGSCLARQPWPEHTEKCIHVKGKALARQN
jgi:hypothetical protein